MHSDDVALSQFKLLRKCDGEFDKARVAFLLKLDVLDDVLLSQFKL